MRDSKLLFKIFSSAARAAELNIFSKLLQSESLEEKLNSKLDVTRILNCRQRSEIGVVIAADSPQFETVQGPNIKSQRIRRRQSLRQLNMEEITRQCAARLSRTRRQPCFIDHCPNLI